MMHVAANVLVVIVAALHVYALVLEMFLWTKPFGRRTFGLTPEFAQASKSLAANQGLYNGFLAAGLVYGLAVQSREIVLLFLVFVIVAGAYGAATVNTRIFFLQAFPAIIASVLVGWR